MKALLLLGILTIQTCFAQSEPDSIDKKDFIEEIGRSDLELSDTPIDVKIESMVPKLTLPQLEVDTLKKPVPDKKKKKPKTINKQDEPKSINKKKEEIKPRVEKQKNQKQRLTYKKRIVHVRKALKYTQFKKNDKISLDGKKIHVYRLLKKNVLRYKYNDKFPLESTGLKGEGENNYLVIDKEKFIADIKLLIHPVKNSNNEVQIKSDLKNDDILGQRTYMEKRYNSGKKIIKNIKIINLKTNDYIYVYKDALMVSRKYSNSLRLHRYWLSENINLNNKSIKKVAKNKYKLFKHYHSDE